jgi:hypothetical protein
LSGRTLGRQAQAIKIDVRPLQQAGAPGNGRVAGFTSPAGRGLIRFRLLAGGTLEVCGEALHGTVIVPGTKGSHAAPGDAAGAAPAAGEESSAL